MNKFIKTILLIFVFSIYLFSQWNVPDDAPGKKENIKTGTLNGNKVITNFTNNNIVNNSFNIGGGDQGMWPSTEMAKAMSMDTYLLINYKIFLDSNGDPIQDIANIDQAVDTLYFVENGFKEADQGLLPASGYSNPAALTPALSDDPNTWPTSWPTERWNQSQDKVWYGRLGKDYHNSDLETYFVTNNYNSIDDGASIKNRGGIEIRCTQRSYQWEKCPMADMILWEYEITNTSDYNALETNFGFLRNNAIGGEEYKGNEVVYYDTLDGNGNVGADISYTWDVEFLPIERPAYPGIVGFAITETPGSENDGTDNDGDGIIDEGRYNPAGASVPLTEGIANTVNFRKFFGIDTTKWNQLGKVAYFEGDEDKDWKDGVDKNGDGIYQYGTDKANDDVGIDGIGPYDLGYEGPDEGEGNHKPDFGEPNFGPTDYAESDQISLENFIIINNNKSSLSLYDDQAVFSLLDNQEMNYFQNIPSNYSQLLSTEDFVLNSKQTERISYAEIHSYDYLSELTSIQTGNMDDMRNKKEIVERIVLRDYTFANPPIMPQLQAYSGDGQITLMWDDWARKFTYDHFDWDQNDFEGYKIYKSTDKEMLDAKIVTNGYGELVKYKPIKQYDLLNEVSGIVNYGVCNGSGYFLGNDDGIKNHFVDDDVTNGRKYYYALVAYDKGIENYIEGEAGKRFGASGVGEGVAPSENDFSFAENETKNVASITPMKKALSYSPPNIEIVKDDINFGTGYIEPSVYLPTQAKEGHTYKIKFGVEEFLSPLYAYSPKARTFRTKSINIYDVTGEEDTLIYREDENYYVGNNFDVKTGDFWPGSGPEAVRTVMTTDEELKTGVFQGLVVNWFVDAMIPQISYKGWLEGSGDVDVTVFGEENPGYKENDGYFKAKYGGISPNFPFDFDVVFTSNQGACTTATEYQTQLGVYGFTNASLSNLLHEYPLSFYVLDRNVTDSLGRPDTMDLVIHDVNENGTYEPAEDNVYVGAVFEQMGAMLWMNRVKAALRIGFESNDIPQSGVYGVRWERGFWKTDSLVFQVNEHTDYEVTEIEENMDQIKVVPNPYIVTNLMERQAPIGEREHQLMFTNLPPQCKIKIFTITGIKIDEISFNNTTTYENINNSGVVKWDLKTDEGNDIAAGYYIYKIESELTDKKKVGKFAIIK